ncbi:MULTISPECIES: sensor histidine kinase [Streptomyces]|uniref:histidine kinase n=1 Tax=Streptomyces rubrolavendulae TaxID=285473 RepID=A0A1D8G7W8_9ACTN|nr:ATP-binding protein [Streptomyces rubrolavendulae]AOT61544.1 sensory histidine kinase CreC [Streptomyces rubrolavendulae]
MPVPARPRQRRSARGPRSSPIVLPAALLVTAVGGAVVTAAAPAGARGWVAGTAAVAWVCIAVLAAVSARLLRGARRQAASLGDELETARSHWARQSAEASQLVNATLPGLAQQVRGGARPADALARVSPPADPHQRRLLDLFATELAAVAGRADEAEGELRALRAEITEGGTELERLTAETLPAAVSLLRQGSSADTVLTRFDWPKDARLRAAAEWFVRELAYSERRSAAAEAASAKALSRVQAKTVSMLADLRDMQDRHGGEIFGDLLRLDHSTSQLGLMTDRLALLMGGRSSRVWNKPIVVESILRGAVGRIAAYRRVRLHNSSKAAISGFAAEGVMHLLAELMDNAANFSPPIDEVHVYVEERSAGLVVTIEDSGLKMADAAMRRAEEAVSGRVTDLASLQGTRLGLAVVGRLAAKYGISVNYRPSSRGGTGVVVLLPPQLVAQQREPVVPARPHRSPSTAPAPIPAPAPAAPAEKPVSAPAPAPAAEEPAPAPAPSRAAEEPLPVRTRTPDADTPSARPAGGARGGGAATPGGLPVRAPGRTMAEAERDRRRPAAETPPAPRREPGPARDAGSRFGAFHRGRSGGAPGPEEPRQAPPDE